MQGIFFCRSFQSVMFFVSMWTQLSSARKSTGDAFPAQTFILTPFDTTQNHALMMSHS